jgi:hypothetical protein
MELLLLFIVDVTSFYSSDAARRALANLFDVCKLIKCFSVALLLLAFSFFVVASAHGMMTLLQKGIALDHERRRCGEEITSWLGRSFCERKTLVNHPGKIHISNDFSVDDFNKKNTYCLHSSRPL